MITKAMQRLSSGARGAVCYKNILSELRLVMKDHSTVSSEHQGAVFDALVEICFDSVMISEATPKNPIISVNKAFSELAGYSTEELLGKSPGFLQGPGTDASVVQRLHADMVAGRVFEGKAVNYRKDGSHFTMWWRVIPVTSNSAQTVYFVAFQREALLIASPICHNEAEPHEPPFQS